MTPGVVRKELNIRTISPILGAGSKPLYPDRYSYVRGGTIRGLLRYWWRACQIKGSLEELTQKEAELFGKASQAGKLMISITDVRDQQSDFAGRLPGYVRFPYTDADTDPESVALWCSISLRLEYPEKYETEMDNALWAWANFGGIGMRTRRGAGALKVDEYALASPAELEEELKRRLPGLGNTEPQERPWSVLSPRLLWGRETDRAHNAWRGSLKPLMDFRRASFSREKSGGRPKWPEADSLRRIHKAAECDEVGSRDDKDAFPRAELGLPLIIKFRDGEPEETAIYPREGGRRPSPIILKPLALQGNQFVPLALIMDAPSLTGIRLKVGEQEVATYGPAHTRGPNVCAYKTSPLRCFDADNAVDAFVNLLISRDWRGWRP